MTAAACQVELCREPAIPRVVAVDGLGDIAPAMCPYHSWRFEDLLCEADYADTVVFGLGAAEGGASA